MDIYEDMVFSEYDDYEEDVPFPNPKMNKSKSPKSCYSTKHTRIAFQQRKASSISYVPSKPKQKSSK